MASTISLTQEQFERIASDVVGVLMQEALINMQRKVQAAGLVMTGELMDTMRTAQVIIGRELYAEFSIGFAGYGRFNDMRQLLYSAMPPIEAMEEFVRNTGLEKFGYVPGYRKDAKFRVYIPDSRAINRIAWGVARSRLFTATIRQGKRNAFYNTTRGKLVHEATNKILQALPEPILKAIKEQFE